VLNGNGIARHALTGELFALLQINSDPICGGSAGAFARQRRHVKINPANGVATSVGNTGDCFAGIAFTSNGTLYGVTGDGAAMPTSRFTLNKSNGTPTFVMALAGTGSGDQGG